MAAPIFLNKQANPAAATLATLYTVGAGRRAACSTLVAAETGGNASKIRVHVCSAGAAGSVGNAIVYDAALAANSVATFTIGLTVNPTDLVRVQSDTGSVTFTLFGEETDVPAS
ncbi:MAG TPA: hypothetical protein VFT75_18310 [Nocardioidaceae bacterium]|nr:hypothetical protein [Nocardioidaceae bacterium]